MALALLCATSLFSAEPVRVRPAEAWYEGRNITLVPAVSRHGRVMKVGDTVLGALVTRKPDDSRPNLYVVAPGQQHRGPAQTGFNLVVNELSESGAPAPIVWDVYWALVLDPSLNTDFTGERELLLATQDGFMPDQTAFEESPAAGFLRLQLRIDSFAGLDSYRREDGMLPRVIIVPAGKAVRASAVGEASPPTAANPIAEK